MPESEWRRVTELQSVVGVQYRKPNAIEFAKAVFTKSGKAVALVLRHTLSRHLDEIRLDKI